MIYKNIKERHEHKIGIMSNKIDELESDIQQWISFNKDKEHQIYLLENELKEYRKLKSSVHKDIEQFMMEHLEDVLNFNKEQMNELHDMDNTEGKNIYGSIQEFKKARSIWAGKVMQIEDLLTYFKFQLKK